MVFENSWWGLWGGWLHTLPPLWLFIGLLTYTFVVTHITIEAVTIYLHRTATHGGVILKESVSKFFRFWLWLTTGMKTKEWVAIHRKHHQNVDTENDPHSPVFFGLESWTHKVQWVFWKGVRKYVEESHKPETMEKHGHGTPDDELEEFFQRRGYYFGVLLSLPVLNFFLFGFPGLIIWGIQAIWIPVFAAGVINGLGHGYGYQNYKLGDPKYPNVKHSTNICKWGWFIGGEELHNNHHADGSSPFFAHKPDEFDLGGEVIRILCRLGLAELRKPES